MLLDKDYRSQSKRLSHVPKQVSEVQHLVNLALHPNVVQIIRSKEQHTPLPTLYIAMELCSLKTLQDYLDENRKKKVPVNFKKAMSYSKGLVRGLTHIHGNRVIHGDLKPENILFSLDRDQIKISDFGISKELRQLCFTTKITSQGTDGYRAPETYNSDVISTKADIYSLAVNLYSLFTNGKHPFGEDSDLWMYNMKNNKGRDLSGLPEEMGDKKDEFLDLLDKMLEFDPKKRPTIEETSDHPFFSSSRATPAQASPEEVETSRKTAADETQPKEGREVIVQRPGRGPSHRRGNPPEKASRHVFASAHTQPEEANSIVIFNRAKATLEAFTPSTSFLGLRKKWISIVLPWKIPNGMIDRRFTVVSLDDYIYVLTDKKTLYGLNYADFEARWQRRAETIENHGWMPPLVAMDGALYAIGRGYSPYPECSRIAEKYDSNKDEWTLIKHMKGLREFHYVVAMDGYIYSFGGYNEKSGVSRAVERYHASTDSWEDVSPMPREVFLPMRGVAVSGLLYVIGSDSMQTYDPGTETWTILTLGGHFPFDKGAAFSLLTVDGEVTAVGKSKGTNKICRLDRRKITWKKIPGLETIHSIGVAPRESVAVNLKIHPSI